MNEQERLDKQLRDENGKRMVAFDAHVTDARGVIWCMVSEDTAGYRPMTGRDELSMPWYLAYFTDHTREDGTIDYHSAHMAAHKLADNWNWDNGYTPKEVMLVVSSSMRSHFTQNEED